MSADGSAPLLQVEDLHTYLGESHIVQGVSLNVQKGSVVAILGRNGAGKTTILRSIMHMVRPRSGRVTIDGKLTAGMQSYEVARAGLAIVQETRAIFPSLSVEENLVIAQKPGVEGNDWSIDRIFEDFPNLAARRNNGGTQLSGGEQQMLAIARGLVANPRVLLLDEPSEGLAPLIVRQIAELLEKLKLQGMTMLLVEQNLAMALRVADQVIVLGKGRVRWTGSSDELRKADDIRHTWLGV